MKPLTSLLLCALALTLTMMPVGVRAQTAPTFTILHAFSKTDSAGENSDGADPANALIQGHDGNYFGNDFSGGTNGHGTVFSITPTGKFTTLFSFSPGGGDDGELVQGRNDDFYGTTVYGGTSGHGTITKITPTGVQTTLHTFTGGADGQYPDSLILGKDGNFYGPTYSGGSNGYGTIFKITPAGALTTLYSFTGGADGFFPYAALVQGSDGNFYGTTYYGGGVFKLSPAGTLTVLHSFSDTANYENTDGANPATALVQGRDGNFYGKTGAGGSGGEGTLFKITPAGVLTTLHNFARDENSGGLVAIGALLQGSDGDLYGTTFAGGTNGVGAIFKVTSAGVFTTLHNFTAAEGAGPQAALIQSTDGSFFGTSTGYNNRIHNYTGNGSVFRLTIAPAITSSGQVTAAVGHSFSYQIIASNKPTSYTATGLPAGLSANAQTGLISGTPQAAGAFNVALTARNAYNQANASLSLTVAAAGAPYITSAAMLSVPEDHGFSYQITATDSPTTYGVEGLPPGVTVNSKTGLITGNHHGLGTVTLTLNAYNAKGKGSASLTLMVYGVPVITSGNTAGAFDGQPFSYQITASNEPTSYSVQGLPSGLSFDTKTGLISGTHHGAGMAVLTLNAYNVVGKGSATLNLYVYTD